MLTVQERGLPCITLKEATIRVRDRFILPGTSWEIRTGEQWAVLGPNGAGKSSLVKALTGELPCVRGRITCHFRKETREAVGYVSFDLQEYLVAAEDARDMGHNGLEGRLKVRETILEGFCDRPADMGAFNRIVDLLGIRRLLDRGFRHLSSGEMRRVIIARALIRSPEMLILDEPFAGLDARSRKTVRETIEGLIAGGMQVILVTHRQEEIFPWISHVICLKNGRVFSQGSRDEVLTPENLKRLYLREQSGTRPGLDRGRALDTAFGGTGEIMVEMRQVTVKYGEAVILDCLDWTVRRGENWAVVGPNGSGKSTLLSLVTADNPQAYANEIYLFGRRRGTGESLWEIKRRIGMVSTELQARYRRDITAYDVTASGLFDSIGLYRRLTATQTEQVERWLGFFGIADMAHRIFTRLSYGERRMILLARAMVKSPEMLVLDEPCQGLDRENRRLFLDMVEMVGSRTDTTVIYVTHYESEIPKCTNRILRLEKPVWSLPS
jgi:molybdate transport system ATP-binding protein